MKKKKNTLLWELKPTADSDASYLFGTMHVRDLRAFDYLDLVKQKILDCEAFAAEMDLDASNEMSEESAAIQQQMFLKGDLTVDKLLKKKDLAKLEKLVQEKMNLPLKVFNKQLPFVLMSSLASNSLQKEMSASLDITLWEYAKDHGKSLHGVETLADHMGVLPQIPLDYQVKALRGIINNFTKYTTQTMKMAKLYQSGDIQKMYKATKKSIGGMRKLLLYDRNYKMANSIDLLINEQTTLCAVGAAHLAGKKGILRLLKQKGVLVKPVQNCPL